MLDREFAADLVTRYYTDFEPEMSWVAEIGGQVAGYLTGALDTRRYHRIMALRVVPLAVVRGVFRGMLFRAKTWRMLGAVPRNLRRYRERRRQSLADYPAHLHVDILAAHRGKGLGSELLQHFFEALERRGIPGVHATVRGDNPAGRSFFERRGFRPVGQYAMAMMVEGSLRDVQVLIYGKRLGSR